MKKLIVRIKGGLGNQMFQYAMARAFQLKYQKYELFLDTYDAKKNVDRPLDLLLFNIDKNVKIVEDGSFEMYSRASNVFLRIGMKFFPKLVFEIYKQKGVYLWDEDNFIDIYPNNSTVYFNGYWQSAKYFQDFESIIKKEFTCKYIIDRSFSELKKQLKNHNSVCVHIRLGDYLELKNKSMNICTPNYYFRAIKHMKNLIDNPHFYVFSDSIIDAKKILFDIVSEKEITYVNTDSAFTDFQLMRESKNFIISNSTFSWWTQYLSEYNDKIVIAPIKWKKKSNSRDIYLDSWILEEC